MPRYAIISDIHSNWEALSVVLEKCVELEVDGYLSLGDLVGYNADPAKCVEAVQNLNLLARVRGNHDEYTGGDDTEMEGFNNHARNAILWTRSNLSEDDRKWLMACDYRTSVPQAGITLVHATLDSPNHWGYIFDVHHALDNFSYQFTPLCFCGHSHVPVAFVKHPVVSAGKRSVEEIDEWLYSEEYTDDYTQEASFAVELQMGSKYLFNVGSIGQPRNRDPRASFAVYDSVERKVTRYCLPYDIATTQQKVFDAGLPERLALRLALGT